MPYKDKKRENERKRKQRARNVDHWRERERNEKRKQRERRSEEINRLARERYARNKSVERAKIYASRIKRNPALGLEYAVREFERGDRSLAELIRLYDDRLARLHEGDVCE